MTTKQKQKNKDWEIKTLGEVCEIVTGNTPKTSHEEYYGGSVLWAGPADLDLDMYVCNTKKKLSNEGLLKGRARIVPKGSVLMSCIGYIGKLGIAYEDMTSNQQINTFIPNKEILDSKFLFYQLKTKTKAFKNLSSRATLPIINKTKCSQVSIKVPLLKEQKRIVGILDEKFGAIDKLRKITEQQIVDVNELFESWLSEVCGASVSNWTKTTIGDVCELAQGLAINAKTKHFLVKKSSLPLLRIKDLKNNEEEQYVDDVNYPKNCLISDSDLIYTRTGQVGLVFRGRTGILHNNSFKITPKSLLRRSYLFWWLQNPSFKSKIISLSSRTAQPDITHKIFKAQTIIIPPIKKQEEITKELDELSEKTKKLEVIFRRKITDLEELKKSYLHEAFSGNL